MFGVFLSRLQWRELAKDKAGNVLYITALMIIPILAMVGGGIDMGRAYMAQNRLQNACDAGVLAARKSQTTVNIMTDTTALDAGESFFDHNFADGMFGVDTDDDTFTLAPGANGSAVAGSATIEVDNAIMGLFGFESIELEATCEADIDAENTDIMLVLDTTISMNRSLGGTQKITALRAAVEEFHKIVQAGYVPGRNRIRYGVVPYAGTVNVGQELIDLDPSYLVGADTSLQTTHEYSIRKWNGSEYVHSLESVDVTEYVESMDTANPAPQIPGHQTAGTTGDRWDGCIEERETYHIGSSELIINSDDAKDLDIDLVPDGSYETRWRPYWYEIARRTNLNGPSHDSNCPTPVRRMAEVLDYDDGTSDSFGAYIDGLDLALATNQVAGLTWGARLLSPDGLFSGDNGEAPNGQPIARHVVFMTDGRLWFNSNNYDAYGINAANGRFAPTETGKSGMDNRGYRRMAAVCDALKAKGFTVWTVEFENDSTVSSSLQDCASSSDHAFPASNAAELSSAFSAIANQVGGLRLSE